MIKTVRLTSLLPDMPRVLSPKPRLRHGRRHTHLSLPNMYVFSFIMVFALLPHLHPLLTSTALIMYFSRESASVFADYLKSQFSVYQSKALRSRAKGYLSKLRRATCPRESRSCFCSLFSPDKISAAATNFFSFTATGQTKFPIPC